MFYPGSYALVFCKNIDGSGLNGTGTGPGTGGTGPGTGTPVPPPVTPVPVTGSPVNALFLSVSTQCPQFLSCLRGLCQIK